MVFFSRLKKGRLSLGMENEFLKAIASVALPTPMSDYFTVVGVEQTEIHISQTYNNFPQKKTTFSFFLVERHTYIILFIQFG